MEVVVIDQWIHIALVASLLGFILLYTVLIRKIAKKYRASKFEREDYCSLEAPRKSQKEEHHHHHYDTNTDVIIVGAGVAGSALAYALGIDGRRVHVIERDITEPSRIVGEVLQPGGYLKLIELGLEDCVKDIDAQRLSGYAFYKDGKHAKLLYPSERFSSDVSSGRCFHNGRFVQRMREKVATVSNVRLEQGSVTSLIKENGTIKGVKYKTKNGLELVARAPFTVVCDGCFSNLRRFLCDHQVHVPSYFVALVLKNGQLPFPNLIHAVLANSSPIVFYRISSTEIRCMIEVPGEKVPSISNGDMEEYLKKIMAPQIPQQLYDGFISAIKKGNIKRMPYRIMPCKPHSTPGGFLIGDAFNMRHPLTGGGMTVALSDVVVLRDLLRRLHDLQDPIYLNKHLQSFYTIRKPMAFTINTMADALSKVFCATLDLARQEIRGACFDYLSLGGVFTRGPMSLVSGLNPTPLSLVLHFFAFSSYVVGRLLLPFPSITKLWLGVKMIYGASGIILPIIRAEGVSEQLFRLIVPAYFMN